MKATAGYENNQPHSDDSHPVRLPTHDSSGGADCGFGVGAAGVFAAAAFCTGGAMGAGVEAVTGAGEAGADVTCGADAAGDTGWGLEGEAVAVIEESGSLGSGVTRATRLELSPAVSVDWETRSMSPMSGACRISFSYRSMTACIFNSSRLAALMPWICFWCSL